MSQTDKLLDVLKRYLKAHEVTYKDLAKELNLSEASIKRLFSKRTISLQRLDDICKVIDLDFYDLVKMLKISEEGGINTLSAEQESILANDPKLLSCFYLLVNGWSPQLITIEFSISAPEVEQVLFKLEQLELIEVHPNHKIRFLISKNVFWRKDGPIWNLYRKSVQDDFLDSQFELPHDRLLFISGKLSENSEKIIVKQIDKLVTQFNELVKMDSMLPLKGRCSTAFFLGFRHWVFSVISDLKKEKL
ncbi:MAG: DNA-binding Xre family transcriptional regulator [bacterium]|jgi:DNA-binding Xre family transcriptional regulator